MIAFGQVKHKRQEEAAQVSDDQRKLTFQEKKRVTDQLEMYYDALLYGNKEHLNAKSFQALKDLK